MKEFFNFEWAFKSICYSKSPVNPKRSLSIVISAWAIILYSCNFVPHDISGIASGTISLGWRLLQRQWRTRNSAGIEGQSTFPPSPNYGITSILYRDESKWFEIFLSKIFRIKMSNMYTIVFQSFCKVLCSLSQLQEGYKVKKLSFCNEPGVRIMLCRPHWPLQ